VLIKKVVLREYKKKDWSISEESAIAHGHLKDQYYESYLYWFWDGREWAALLATTHSPRMMHG
jgi:hypothetical protein